MSISAKKMKEIYNIIKTPYKYGAQSVDKVGVGALAPAPLFFSDEIFRYER